MSRVVVKLGSALLTREGLALNHLGIANWSAQVAELMDAGHQVVVVSSGAVAAGLGVLGLSTRPKDMPSLQAAAAAGQSGLASAWQAGLQAGGKSAAQVLLTHEDLSDRARYLNARATLSRLLELGVVPVVNENDTVVTAEIRFGDNDTLAAMVANLIQADTLIILTDQAGMYREDPRRNPEAELLTRVRANDRSLDAMATGGAGSLGRGGMLTKVKAARLAARSGANTWVAHGERPNVLMDALKGESVGTLFQAAEGAETARKRWLAGHVQVRGEVTLDAGAVKAVVERNGSLLPVGVTHIEGDFRRGEAIALVDAEGQRIAVGLSNYAASDARKILGASSADLPNRLTLPGEPELVHRDNLALNQ